jgi:hypothetical protein
MSQTCLLISTPNKIRRLLSGGGIALLMLLLFSALVAPAAQPPSLEDQYLQVVANIQDADLRLSNGQTESALKKYEQAQTALYTLQKYNPAWNPNMVKYRLGYLAQKLEGAQQSGGVAATGTPGATSPAAGAKPAAGLVKLVSAGDEPRTALRLQPEAGSTQSMGVSIEMGVVAKVGDVDAPAVKLPPMQMTMDVAVKEVSPEGDITYDITMGEATLAEAPDTNPQIVEAMKSSMANLKGMGGTAKVSNRGLSLDSQVKTPAAAGPEARQTVDQINDSIARMALTLPEEPVGVGATWEATMPVKSQGMTIDQVSTIKLVARDGDIITLETTLVQTAANQKIASPAMPQMKVDLIKMTGKGSGQTIANLKQVLPTSGKLDTHSEMNMGMSMGGQKQTMQMTMDVTVQFEAK